MSPSLIIIHDSKFIKRLKYKKKLTEREIYIFNDWFFFLARIINYVNWSLITVNCFGFSSFFFYRAISKNQFYPRFNQLYEVLFKIKANNGYNQFLLYPVKKKKIFLKNSWKKKTTLRLFVFNVQQYWILFEKLSIVKYHSIIPFFFYWVSLQKYAIKKKKNNWFEQTVN